MCLHIEKTRVCLCPGSIESVLLLKIPSPLVILPGEGHKGSMNLADSNSPKGP